jgi:hypothetical protein
LGLIVLFIVVDAVINITSPTPCCSAVTLARALLIEGGPKVYLLLAVLIDLSLEFTELLELGPPRPLGGRHRGPRGGPVGSTY